MDNCDDEVNDTDWELIFYLILSDIYHPTVVGFKGDDRSFSKWMS